MDSRFAGNDNYGKPRSEYLARLAEMTEEKLLETTETIIWLSAYASNNRRSDYHWQVSACHYECGRRGKSELYSKAYERVRKSCGC